MGKKRVIEKTEAELLAEKEKLDKTLKKEQQVKSNQTVRSGRIYILSTYNNTIISLTDNQGNILAQSSAGKLGFKGTKKGTSFAGSQVAQAIGGLCSQLRVRNVAIYVKGIGGGRDSALKVLATQGLEIETVKDITPIPHNGCRPKKPRRV